MLKKIADWKARAGELAKEIKAKNPTEQDDDLEGIRLLDVCDKHRDPVMTELVMLADVPERERVACGWIMAEDIAGRLLWYLSGLEGALRQRLERKGVSNLPAPSTEDSEQSQPDGDVKPGECVAVEG